VLHWLFDTTGFMTRNQCGSGWTRSLISIYQVASFFIFVSYMSIPLPTILFWKIRRNDTPGAWILLLFAAFIFFCGIIHINDVFVFYYAPYRFYTLIVVITALISVLTALFLPKIVFNIMKLASREMIHKLRSDLNVLIMERELEKTQNIARNDKLISKVKTLEATLEKYGWRDSKEPSRQLLQEIILTIGSENSVDRI